MKKKLTVCLLIVLALACLSGVCVFTALNLKKAVLPDPQEHFKEKDKTYDVQISATKGGRVNDLSGWYSLNDILNLEATPDDGYIFMGWFNENDEYLTTSLKYNFTVKGAIKLIAKFCLKPEEIKGESHYFENLRGCQPDFSFTVKCDRPDAEEYLLKNLQIIDSDLLGTPYEDQEEAKPKFTVEKNGENEYLIKPVTEYTPGVTYEAKLSEEAAENVSFVTEANTDDSLTFGITKEQTSTADVKTNLVYIPSAFVVERSDGGVVSDTLEEEWVILTSDFGLEPAAAATPDEGADTASATNSLFCLCSDEKNQETGAFKLAENSVFGKCVSITPLEGGTWKVVYITPELDEIFQDFDIYTDGEVNFEDSDTEVSDDLVEQVRYAIFTNKEFQNTVAAMQLMLQDQFANSDYEVEPLSKTNLMDMLDVKVSVQIKNSIFYLTTEISVNFPISTSKGNQVAQIALKYTSNKEISVKTGFNYVLRRWWFIPVGINSYDINAQVHNKETVLYGIYVSYDEGSDGIDKLKEEISKDVMDKELAKQRAKQNGRKLPIKSTANDIQDLFTENGYSVGSRREIKLLSTRVYIGILTVNLDLKFFLDFDISGSMYYTVTTDQYQLSGIRSTNGGRGQRYEESRSQTEGEDLIIIGTVGIKAGISCEAYFSMLGLSKFLKVGIGVEMGYYAKVEGYVSILSGQYAGKLEAGIFAGGYIFCKIFSYNEKWYLLNEEIPLVRLGNNKTLMSWTDYSDIRNGSISLAIIGKEAELFKQSALQVNTYTIGSGVRIEYLDYDALRDQIHVRVTDGTYLEYRDGKLYVKDGAPLYFEDEITVTVDSSPAFSVFGKDSYCSYLPELTIKVKYGNEDAYYEAIDSEVQKGFRSLYRSYNKENSAILSDMFQQLLDSVLNEKATENAVYGPIVSEYLNALFTVIGERRSRETPEMGRTLENEFVYAEADAFSKVVDMINQLLKSKQYNEEDCRAALLALDYSEALFDAFLNTEQREDFDEITAKFNLSQEKKETVNNSISWYRENTKRDAESAERLIAVFEKMLKLKENSDETTN